MTEASAARFAELRGEAGMVFQHLNLYPHKTVLENVTLAPIKVLESVRQRLKKTAEKFLRYVNMWTRRIHTLVCFLVGKQRIAIARGLAMNPELCLTNQRQP